MNEHEKGQVAVSAAQIYEEFFVPALFADWPPRLLEAAGVQAGSSLLDVACGTGILAREAAAVIGVNGSVVGIDINEGMLAVAREQGARVSWRLGPAEALPFENDAFDHVVSQFGLMFFEDQVNAIREMARVVRPGGTTAVAVWASLADTPGYNLVAQILDELFGPEVAKSIQIPYALGDRQRLKALFAEAGVADLKIQTIAGRAQFKSIESWMFTDIKGWTLADVIDDEGYEMFRQYAFPKLTQFEQADGTVAFDAPAHIVTASF